MQSRSVLKFAGLRYSRRLNRRGFADVQTGHKAEGGQKRKDVQAMPMLPLLLVLRLLVPMLLTLMCSDSLFVVIMLGAVS